MEVYSFMLREMKGNKEEADGLAKALGPFGIQVKYDRSDYMNDYYKLTFVFDKENLQLKRTRNAGIKARYNERVYDETVESVRLRLRRESQEAVAKSLGISRMTLYRKLKKAESENRNSDYPFYLL